MPRRAHDSGANAPGPTPPECPKGLSENAWTALLWEKTCSHCWATTTRPVDWGFRRRLCTRCRQKHAKGQPTMRKRYRDLSADVFRLVPYSYEAGSGEGTRYYWQPELEEVYNVLKRLDERVEARQPHAKKNRERYITERKGYVEEVLDAVNECKEWEERQRKAAQDQLRKEVVKSLVNMGYDVADVEDVLREARITEASVSDWNAFLKKYKPALDSRQRPLATESPSELLRSEYRRLLKTHNGPARGWGALVPFGDILAIPDVRSRFERLSADNVANLAKRIPALVDTWREDIEAQLLRTLPPPPKDMRKADAENPERLKLASSVWRRGKDSTPLSFPHMLLEPHLLCFNREYGELKYATADGPWSIKDLVYDVAGAGVVREFCKFASLSFSTATVAYLDHSTLRLQCTKCRDVWPLVLTWRQAIKHLHEIHANDGSGSWKPFPSTIDEPVATIEAGLEVWACADSVCTRPLKLRNVAAIEKHLEEKHNVGRAIKGKNYIRALTVPLSEPLNLLELYAEMKDDFTYECRRCHRSASLDRMVEHLRNEHDAPLGSGVPARRPVVTSEDDEPVPRSKKRHISISSSSSDEAVPPSKKRALGGSYSESPSHPAPQAPSLPASARVLDQRRSDEDVSMDEATGDAADPSSEMEDIEEEVLARLAHDPVSSKTKVDNADKPGKPASQVPTPAAIPAVPLPQFACMRCTRNIDRFRHMPHHSIVHHLALKHYIVEPVLGRDYSQFDPNARDLPAVMPWSLKKVYTCLLCKPTEHDERATWSQLEHHLITAHKIVDPVAKRDFDGPSAREENAGARPVGPGEPAGLTTVTALASGNGPGRRDSEGVTQRQIVESARRPEPSYDHYGDSDRASAEDLEDSGKASKTEVHAQPGERPAGERPWESTRAATYRSPSYEDDAETDDASDETDCDDECSDDDECSGGSGSEDEGEYKDANDTGASTAGEEPLSYRAVREKVRNLLKGRGASRALDTCDFYCRHCATEPGRERRRYDLHGIVAHLASPLHSIGRPNLREDIKLKQSMRPKEREDVRYECLLCETGKRFNENGMKNHLADKHGYNDPDGFKTHSRDMFLKRRRKRKARKPRTWA